MLEDFLDGAIVLGAAIAVIILSVAAMHAISLPIVQVSHSTGECVQVIGKGSCDELPEKYTKEWVK